VLTSDDSIYCKAAKKGTPAALAQHICTSVVKSGKNQTWDKNCPER